MTKAKAPNKHEIPTGPTATELSEEELAKVSGGAETVTAREASSGMATGRRQYDPIKLSK